MTTLFYIGFIAVCLLVLIAATAGLRWTEQRFPRVKEWLDEHVGPDPVWDR